MSPQDNALLTGIGPGTPMGALMREYWTPACLSSELPAGGAPMPAVGPAPSGIGAWIL